CEQLGDPEVQQPRHALLRHQNIAWLDVTVDHQVLVGVAHGRADGLKELQSVRNGQLTSIAVQVNRLAFNVLHDEVGQAVAGRAAIQQASDVGVIEHGQDLALTAKSQNDIVGIQSAADDFDGHEF